MEWLGLLVFAGVIYFVAKISAQSSSSTGRQLGRTVGGRSNTAHGGAAGLDSDEPWERQERELKRQAFDQIVQPIEDLLDSVKKELWRELRNNSWPRDQFEVIIGSRAWRWPWLDHAINEFRKEDVEPGGLLSAVANGPPKPPKSIDEIIHNLSVARMREFLKSIDRYPKPAPRKRVEFEAVFREVPWAELKDFALEEYRLLEPEIKERYRKDKIALLVQTLGTAAYSFRTFLNGQDPDCYLVAVPEENIVAAREAMRFNASQKTPLPPFYPGDRSTLQIADKDIRKSIRERVQKADANLSYRTFWLNAKDADDNADFPEARKWYQKAGMAVVGADVPEDERQRLKDDAAECLARDPAYIICLHELKKLIAAEPGIRQSAIYERIPHAKQDVMQVLYFAEENREIVRKKAGNSYELYLMGKDSTEDNH